MGGLQRAKSMPASCQAAAQATRLAIGRMSTVGVSRSRLRDDVVMRAGLELEDALRALRGPVLTLSEAQGLTPRKAGLYAFYGDEAAWADLGLTAVFSEQPLYVGKAERSLNGRDVRTHFASGKTGSSTVRRSLAALLADSLDLVPVPRNLSKPDGSANFGLTPESDDHLSQWMAERLRLATWVKPEGVDLNEVETAVALQFRPPLNLDKVGEPRARLREARRHMADTARSGELQVGDP